VNYSKHHLYPSRVFYPLAFERSGYIHPAFEDFIDLYARCSSSVPQPQTALQLRFAVAFAITFTTAALLRSVSQRLLPRSLLPFIHPKPLAVPPCWAPLLIPFSSHPTPRILHRDDQLSPTSPRHSSAQSSFPRVYTLSREHSAHCSDAALANVSDRTSARRPLMSLLAPARGGSAELTFCGTRVLLH
jgi:hypothetical protein